MALPQRKQDQIPNPYDQYVQEGAQLLGRLMQQASIVRVRGEWVFVAPLTPNLADQASQWGGTIEDYEPEPLEEDWENEADFVQGEVN
jgi:hypothetical protein